MIKTAEYVKDGVTLAKSAIINLINIRGNKSLGWTGTFIVYKNKTSFNNLLPLTQFSRFIESDNAADIETQMFDDLTTSGILKRTKAL
jgi:hypothetical protein